MKDRNILKDNIKRIYRNKIIGSITAILVIALFWILIINMNPKHLFDNPINVYNYNDLLRVKKENKKYINLYISNNNIELIHTIKGDESADIYYYGLYLNNQDIYIIYKTNSPVQNDRYYSYFSGRLSEYKIDNVLQNKLNIINPFGDRYYSIELIIDGTRTKEKDIRNTIIALSLLILFLVFTIKNYIMWRNYKKSKIAIAVMDDLNKNFDEIEQLLTNEYQKGLIIDIKQIKLTENLIIINNPNYHIKYRNDLLWAYTEQVSAGESGYYYNINMHFKDQLIYFVQFNKERDAIDNFKILEANVRNAIYLDSNKKLKKLYKDNYDDFLLLVSNVSRRKQKERDNL